MKEKETISFDKDEEIINWTLSGLTMYYRDSELEQNIIDLYKVGDIFRSQTFVDVSGHAGKPMKNSRFIFASSKAAPIYKINPDTAKWAFNTLNCNSYFKILDKFEYEVITQFLMLHIPYQGIEFFRRTVLKLNGVNLEKDFIAKGRKSLIEKYLIGIDNALEEEAWIERTSFPIGLDTRNEFFPLIPQTSIHERSVMMYNSLRKLTKDTSRINEIPNITSPLMYNSNSETKSDKREAKKSGRTFWEKLLGKKSKRS